MAKKVFVLMHVHEARSDDADLKIVGIYSTEAQAQAAVGRTKLLPGFKSAPEGFHIDAYELDKDHWVEGYEAAD